MTNLEKNLAALEKTNPPIAEIIRKAERPEGVNGDGPDDYSVSFKGISIPIAGPGEDPIAAAADTAKRAKYLKGDVTIILGAGTGHLLHAVVKRKKKGHIVLMIDPEPWFIQTTLTQYDFSKPIESGELLFVAVTSDIAPAISILESAYTIEQWQSLIANYCSGMPVVYSEPMEQITKALHSIHCNTGTVMGAGYQIAKNDIDTLPYIMPHRGVKDLEGLFKGKPAVLVSTGPSLAKNVWRLNEVQDRVIIIAVAQALRTLLAYGIRPDFITTVDFGEVNYSHFAGLMDKDIPLVCLNRSWAKIIKQYQGPKFIAGTFCPGFEGTAAGISQQKGTMEQGGSVAHFSFALASLLECDPVTFIGQDLSLTDSSHIPTVDSGGKIEVREGQIFWKPTDPKSPLGTAEICHGPAQFVKGYFGDVVMTNIGLHSFINTFENMIRDAKDTGKTICNSTEGGAHLIGSSRITLKDYLKKHCRGTINKSVLLPLLSPDHNMDEMIKGTIPILESDINILNDIRKHCKAGINTNIAMDKARKKKGNDLHLKKLMAENETESNAAHEATKKNNLVSLYIFHQSRRIASRELKVDGKVEHLLKHDKHFETRIKRNREILDAANTAAKELLPIYERALKILREYQETGNRELFTEPAEEFILSSQDVDDYINAGNWAVPMVAGERVPTVTKMWLDAIDKWKKFDCSKEIEYAELIDTAQEQGFKFKNYKEAEKYLEEAVKIFPDRPDARWGLATAYHHNQKLKKSLQEYDWLLKRTPDNLRFQFERALVLLADPKKPSRGIEALMKVMAQTHQYDYFFNQIGKFYLARGETDRAIDAFEHYVKAFPSDIEAKRKLERLKESPGD